MVAPLRPIAAVTRGQGITQLYRVLGGAPAPLVRGGYQLAGIEKYLMKPWTIASEPRRSRPAGPDRGRQPLHGPHARLSGPHLRPALPPLLPHQRPGAGAAGADRAARSTSPTSRRRCSRSPGSGTGSRRSRPATTSASSSPTPPRSSSRPRPGGHLGVLTGRAARGTTWKLLRQASRPLTATCLRMRRIALPFALTMLLAPAASA